MEASHQRETDTLTAATEHLTRIFASANVCESHGIHHATDVVRIVDHALQHCPHSLEPETKIAIRLAALLHDADDRKLFPKHGALQNAQDILRQLTYAGQPLSEPTIGSIIRMIRWVSTAANGDMIPTEAVSAPHLLYPRHADRIAAMGWTGVYRCWKYTLGVGDPLYTGDTARAANEEDLWTRLATPQRYAAYRGKSASMIDHYYDKLLHICNPLLTQENVYLRDEARRRTAPLVEVALAYGRSGVLTEDLYERARSLAEEEKA